MVNVQISVEGETLVLRVNLQEKHGSSKSGKSEIIASTHGMMPVPNPAYTHIRFGLNVYTRATEVAQ